jgi:hypothetical protein
VEQVERDGGLEGDAGLGADARRDLGRDPVAEGAAQAGGQVESGPEVNPAAQQRAGLHLAAGHGVTVHHPAGGRGGREAEQVRHQAQAPTTARPT